MLELINEDLMSYEPVMVTDPNTERVYFKLKVLTSNRLLQREKDIKGYCPKKKLSPSERPEMYIDNRTEKIVPVNREVIRITAPYADIGKTFMSSKKIDSVPLKWREYPMSININPVSKFTNQIDVRCHETGDDRANLYVVAFPFNGMIRPIEEDPKYRIYKGFIASSIKPFFHKNHKYKKILYLVIEINKNLFREDHKYHVDSIDINLESFSLFDDRETGERKTNHETMCLSITSPLGTNEVTWDYEVIDRPVLMNVQDASLWPTYRYQRNDDFDKRVDRYRKHTKGNSSKNQRRVTIDGNTMITTNKHGIRKEVTMGNNRRTPKFYRDKDEYDYEDRKSNNKKSFNRKKK